MNYPKEMWKLLNEITQPKTDKIMCPITGGLDSRVIAYILKLKGVSVQSYYMETPYTFNNSEYTTKLSKLIGVENHKIITIENKHRCPINDAVPYVSQCLDLAEYTFYLAGANGFITGNMLKRENTLRFWIEDPQRVFPSFLNVKSPYKDIIDPTYNPKWVGYFYNLPLKERLFQNCYIKMINEFTPLGIIPRCFDYPNQKPIAINKGFIHYAIRMMKLRKTADSSWNTRMGALLQ